MKGPRESSLAGPAVSRTVLTAPPGRQKPGRECYDSPMQLGAIVATFEDVRSARGRRAKCARLAHLLRSVTASEAVLACTWLSGELPQGKIGVGPALLHTLSPGPAASESRLAAAEVDTAFTEVMGIQGKGSTARRGARLETLLDAATREERTFLMMLLLGELRQGAQHGVMVEAIAEATGLPAEKVRRAQMLTGSLPAVARAALLGGLAAVEAFRVEVGRPLVPMLAQTSASPSEALETLETLDGAVLFDQKLDGVRIQAHKDGEKVRLFSRHLRELTGSAPEIVALVRGLPARRLILDGEALALGPDGPLPFQVTMRRFGRKQDVGRLRETLPLTPVFFDILLRDDEELLDLPLEQRLALLDTVVPMEHRMQRIRTARPEEADAFYDEAIDAGHEGIMAKDPSSPYVAGARGRAWRKIKAVHTLDLIVLAAEWGSGRRTGTLSNLHLGARDPEGGFVMIGKTFKGLTDELLAWQTRELLKRETSRSDYEVRVRPELVVEVAFNDVQVSPQYPGGVALRFARVRGYREDKTAEQADTIDAVRALLPQGHERQAT